MFIFVEEAPRGDGCAGHGGRVVGWRLELLLLDGGDGVGFGRSLGGGELEWAVSGGLSGGGGNGVF